MAFFRQQMDSCDSLSFRILQVNLALVSPVIAVGNSECNSKASHASAFMLLSSSALLEATERHRFLELFHADWLLFPVNWELHLGPHSYVSERSWEHFSVFKDHGVWHKNWPDSASAMSDCFMLAPSDLKKGHYFKRSSVLQHRNKAFLPIRWWIQSALLQFPPAVTSGRRFSGVVLSGWQQSSSTRTPSVVLSQC